jgi:hypothetical protein
MTRLTFCTDFGTARKVLLAEGFVERPGKNVCFWRRSTWTAGRVSLFDALLHKSEDASWLRWEAAGRQVLEHTAKGLYDLHSLRLTADTSRHQDCQRLVVFIALTRTSSVAKIDW